MRPLIILFISIFAIGCAGTRQASNNDRNVNRAAAIQKKYAALLEVSKADISNTELYAFIDDWIGAPYKYAGKTKNGVDCSGFSCILRKEVYKNEVGGSSKYIYSLCKPVSKGKLQEGDFVFFKIKNNKISHMGVFLKNNKFIHASTSRGVVIDDLNADYYKKYYYKGGRLK